MDKISYEADMKFVKEFANDQLPRFSFLFVGAHRACCQTSFYKLALGFRWFHDPGHTASAIAAF